MLEIQFENLDRLPNTLINRFFYTVTNCMESTITPDHVHIFCSFPPRYSPRPPRAISQVVGRLKSLSARAVFKKFPWVKRKLWGGELWEDGYFVSTVGDKVTAEVIRQYIRRHKKEEPDPQLKLF